MALYIAIYIQHSLRKAQAKKLYKIVLIRLIVKSFRYTVKILYITNILCSFGNTIALSIV